MAAPITLEVFMRVAVPTLADFSGCTKTDKSTVAEWTANTMEPSTACAGNSMCCLGSTCEAGTDGMTVTYTWDAVTAGDVYFVCSVGNHCSSGQKLVVTVNAAQTSSSSDCSKQAHVSWAVVFLALLHRPVMTTL